MSESKPPNPKMPSVKILRAANHVVRPLLRSPLHRILSGRLMLLTYQGRKSGREITIPIGYFDWEPNTVLAMSSQPSWIRNLRGGSTVRLRIRGSDHAAVPAVIDDDAQITEILAKFAERKGPKVARSLLLGLPGDRIPTEAELHKAASMTRLVLFHLTD